MSFPPEPTDISPADLKKRKEDFHTESDELARAFTKAMADLDALGAFWGGDETGQRFAGASGGTGYLAARDEAKDHVARIRDGYRKIGDNLGLAGDNVTGANWATVGEMVKAVVGPEIGVPGSKAELE
ncbi:WXG100 family type VII secretion target [Streptosporangium vulgare]|uniref:WXG100 family type VII secretion target n=1 Tax=Streptosporangium vulgare TaxID=46190 RepID=A0ABV5TNW1_9ACTN